MPHLFIGVGACCLAHSSREIEKFVAKQPGVVILTQNPDFAQVLVDNPTSSHLYQILSQHS